MQKVYLDLHMGDVYRDFDVMTAGSASSAITAWLRTKSPAAGRCSQHGLLVSSNKMALITSDCGTVHSLGIKWPSLARVPRWLRPRSTSCTLHW